MLGLQQQERSFVEVDLRVRRSVEEFFEVLPRAFDADGAPPDLDPEVRARVFGEHIGDRVLADRRVENAGMPAQQPVGHEAAIREAHGADPITIAEAFFGCPLDDAEYAPGVLLTRPPLYGAGVRLPVAGRASRVGPEDMEP